MSQKSAIDKQPIIAKAAIHEGDTGSPEVQVALLYMCAAAPYNAAHHKNPLHPYFTAAPAAFCAVNRAPKQQAWLLALLYRSGAGER